VRGGRGAESKLDVGAGLGNQFRYPPITEQQNPPSPPITEQQNPPFLTLKLRIKPSHSPSARQSINPKPDKPIRFPTAIAHKKCRGERVGQGGFCTKVIGGFINVVPKPWGRAGFVQRLLVVSLMLSLNPPLHRFLDLIELGLYPPT